MKMTKEQREAEQAKIDTTVKAVGALLPKGWFACECMAISFSTITPPSMVMVGRNSKAHNEALRVVPAADRKEVRRKWYQQSVADAIVIQQVLEDSGFDARRDGSGVYVRIKL